MRSITRAVATQFAIVVSMFGGTIAGGSNLLTSSHVSQLEAWLGEGPLKLTNVFDHSDGDGKTAYAFHAAADNQGRTFSVVRAAATHAPETFYIVGGYNPQDWNACLFGYRHSPTNAERTGFVFNLSTGLKMAQRFSTEPDLGTGQYQTYNISYYGPTFGGGHDLYVASALGTGCVNQFSYGACPGPSVNCANLLGALSSTQLTITDVEVFTIAADTAVPEPRTAMPIAAAAGIAAAVRRRRKTR